MQIAVMQPYFFPYIVYFQLINKVDAFVILDDVNYINRGWINRNRILVNGKEFLFTIPLNSVSQNLLIKDVSLVQDQKWRSRLIKTISMSYSKAPYFKNVFPLIETCILNSEENLCEYVEYSLKANLRALDIKTTILKSSDFKIKELTGQERIIEICTMLNADSYVNAIGGVELYSKDLFIANNIELKFIKTRINSYKQFNYEFVPNLSIIDILMHNSFDNIKHMLGQYDLI